MPPKQRVRLSRSTSALTRLAASRAAESSQEREARIDEDRIRHAASRAAETPNQTRNRVDNQRTRQAAARAAESSQQREARLDEDRARNAASIAATSCFKSSWKSCPKTDSQWRSAYKASSFQGSTLDIHRRWSISIQSRQQLRGLSSVWYRKNG